MQSKITSLLHVLSYNSNDRLNIFLSLTLNKQALVLLRLSRTVKLQLLKKLSDEQLLPILESLDPNDATDVLQLLSSNRQKILVERLNETMKNYVSVLLQFDEKTAAGLMDVNYLLIHGEELFNDLLKKISVHEERTGRIPIVLVIDDEKLLGYIPSHKFIVARPQERADKYVKELPTIQHSAQFDEVLELIRENPHAKIVVLGENKTVLGVIYSDAVLGLLDEQKGSTLYTFAGLSSEETVFDSVKKKVKFRYKWLIVNLLTAFLASSVVHLFEGTISKNVLLAVYMPIIAGMGGNAGTQTLAVMVRSISSADLTLRMVVNAVKQEVGAGLINGILNGLIICVVVWFLNKDAIVAVTLAFGMVANLMVAAFFGTLVPIAMKKLGKDPASSATVFITTATDVFGFLAFLGLATILLR